LAPSSWRIRPTTPPTTASVNGWSRQSSTRADAVHRRRARGRRGRAHDGDVPDWKRPHAKVGGRYRVGPVTIEVDAVDRVRVDSISASDVKRAGEADLAALLKRLRPPDDGIVWRIAFHVVPNAPDHRAAVAADADLSPADIDNISARLDRLDRGREPWTRAVLELIGKRPGVVSTELAHELGRERFAFKADVRKLKALGLTESLETGYRLSPRGVVFLRDKRPLK
jgi:hypothetical protein